MEAVDGAVLDWDRERDLVQLGCAWGVGMGESSADGQSH